MRALDAFTESGEVVPADDAKLADLARELTETAAETEKRTRRRRGDALRRTRDVFDKKGILVEVDEYAQADGAALDTDDTHREPTSAIPTGYQQHAARASSPLIVRSSSHREHGGGREYVAPDALDAHAARELYRLLEVVAPAFGVRVVATPGETWTPDATAQIPTSISAALRDAFHAMAGHRVEDAELVQEARDIAHAIEMSLRWRGATPLRGEELVRLNRRRSLEMLVRLPKWITVHALNTAIGGACLLGGRTGAGRAARGKASPWNAALSLMREHYGETPSIQRVSKLPAP